MFGINPTLLLLFCVLCAAVALFEFFSAVLVFGYAMLAAYVLVDTLNG